MSSEWWSESLRGQHVGYALGRPRQKFHVYQYTINGPGALHRTALCHGVRGVVIVNSGMDLTSHEKCSEWLSGETGIFGGRRFQSGENLETKLTEYQYINMCERCRTRYEKRKP